MGGLGSGWHRPKAPVVEPYEKFDLADLRKYRDTLAEGESVATAGALIRRADGFLSTLARCAEGAAVT